MIMNVADLIGPTLDYAVADALGYSVWFGAGSPDGHDLKVTRLDGGEVTTLYVPGIGQFSPSTNWAQGGPIIEMEWLDVTPWPNESDEELRWQCKQHDSIDCVTFGPAPLIAAMRCLILHTIAKDGTVVIPDAMFEKPDY